MPADGRAWLPPPLGRRSVLETRRLILAPPDPSDASDLIAAVNDPEVVRWLARVPHPYTEADAAFFLEVVAPAEFPCMARLRDGGALVGMIGLKPGPDATGELGYWLARAMWGQGFATEAAGALVEHAFGSLGLGRLTATVADGNPASRRVLKKLGFVETGRSDRHALFLGRDVPVTEMELARR